MGSVFGSVSDYEAPKYDLVSKREKYEIRAYAPNVAIDGPANNDSNAFGALAKYIGVGSAPNNDRSEAISMTVPVVTYNTDTDVKADDETEAKQVGSSRMQFILPSSLQNPPNPLDKDLAIVHRESNTFAVTTFSGAFNHQQAVAKKNEFVEILAKDNVPVIQPIEWEFWRFNPPWALPWLRTNEIVVKVDKSRLEN
eukprot:CAMPEP_0202693126 /NCGR_PEP_ID=MMETSP1385-20130828/7334_1 /ASSEMBLY_ACC=CAM_ASM_000861 /TAXON_ID=933848 /ORGANISM="Elphidium margaritaceum" /LENGTH=196 /DNA_ID=CAMNT_0049348767 /DNA_START=84 /DNA_END=674 /DNA_ORIENTATION=-